MSEEEKEALKASEADPEIAMSNLYTSISADIATASEIDSEVPVEGLFILKRGKTFYYHGTTCYSCNMMISILAPTATNGPQHTKRAKLSAVKEKAMREAFKNCSVAQAANAEHPNPLRFRSLKTLESELAGRGFRLQFEGDWTWITFENDTNTVTRTAN
ncbi:hypothetical protein V1527DRAFT_448766 [Lipomyces starkeyi]